MSCKTIAFLLCLFIHCIKGNFQANSLLSKTISNYPLSSRILSSILNCKISETQTLGQVCIQCEPKFALANGSCMPCGQYCARCAWSDIGLMTQCIECQWNSNNPYLLYNYRCYVQTPVQGEVQILNNGSVIMSFLCPFSCETCVFKNGTKQCLTLKKGFGYDSTDPASRQPVACWEGTQTCYINQVGSLISTSPLRGFGEDYLNTHYQRCSAQNIGCLSCYNTNSQYFVCTSCISSYYLSNQICQPCSSNCLQCSTIYSCIKCQIGFSIQSYLEAGRKVTICVSCIYGCSRCQPNLQKVACLQCYPGYYLRSIDNCQPCPSNCKHCVDSWNCLECNDDSQMKNGNQCFRRIQNCQLYGEMNNCTLCRTGYLLNASGEFRCLFQQSLVTLNNLSYDCPPHYYLKNYTCVKVQASVQKQKCIEYSQKHCIKCQQGFYIKMFAEICEACPSGCLQCQNSVICTQCKEGFYMSVAGDLKQCKLCHPKCKTCQTESTLCLSCEIDFVLSKSLTCMSKNKLFYKLQRSSPYIVQNLSDNWNRKLLYEKALYYWFTSSKTYLYPPEDQSPYFSDDQLSWYHQIISIRKIVQNGSIIVEGFFCYPNFTLLDRISNQSNSQFMLSIKDINNTIELYQVRMTLYGLTNCDFGYFWNTSTQQCQPKQLPACSVRDERFNGIKCKICYEGYILQQDGQCMLNCSEKGVDDCKICQNITACSVCDSGYTLNQTTKFCVPCGDKNCTQCMITSNNTIQCISCKYQFLSNNMQLRYKIFNNTCKYLNQYGSNFNYAVYDNFAIKCMEGCFYCQTPYTCQVCYSSYFLFNNSICLKCPEDCQNCYFNTSSPTFISCISCYDKFVLEPSTLQCRKITEVLHCIKLNSTPKNACSLCDRSFFLTQEKICESCIQNCAYCQRKDVCYQCQIGFSILFIPETNKSQCIRCSEEGCGYCIIGQDVCLKCLYGYQMNNIGRCIKCIENCLYCKKNFCYSCSLGFRTDNGSCFSLIDNCYRYDAEKCSECFFGYDLNSAGYCSLNLSLTSPVIPCQKGNIVYFGSNCITCSVSDPNCQKCNGEFCLKCKKGFYVATYNTSSINGIFCKPCNNLTGCQTCISKNLCTQCSTGYVLNNFISQYNWSISIGGCIKCDKDCLICIISYYHFPQKGLCTSCKAGFRLTSSSKCVGQYQSNFTLHLKIEKNQFYKRYNEFLDFLTTLINTPNLTKQEQLNTIEIYSITTGSTIISGSFNSESQSDLNSIVANYVKVSSVGSSILGIQILSSQTQLNSSTITITPPPIIQSPNLVPPIVIGAAGGVLFLILVGLVLYYFFRIRKRLLEAQQAKQISQSKSDSQQGKLVSSQSIEKMEARILQRFKKKPVNIASAQNLATGIIQPVI